VIEPARGEQTLHRRVHEQGGHRDERRDEEREQEHRDGARLPPMPRPQQQERRAHPED
jgi:hypothetical protein